MYWPNSDHLVRKYANIFSANGAEKEWSSIVTREFFDEQNGIAEDFIIFEEMMKMPLGTRDKFDKVIRTRLLQMFDNVIKDLTEIKKQDIKAKAQKKETLQN
jgi:hypothetical protein